MITFYPRDISLWREDFDFSKRPNGPNRIFKDKDELSKFIMSKWGMHNDNDFPLKYIENEGPWCPFDSTHTVHKWTTLGWIKEDD